MLNREYSKFQSGRYFPLGGKKVWYDRIETFSPHSKSTEWRLDVTVKDLRTKGYNVRIVTDSYQQKTVYAYKGGE